MTKRKQLSAADRESEPPMPLEELARRMLAMPVKTRADVTKKKAAKPRKKK